MAKDNSFDIVSRTDLNEVRNAVQQTMKEVRQRFDFKGSCSSVSLEKENLQLHSDDEYRLKSLTDVLQQKLVRRGVSLKALQWQKVESAGGGTVRQAVTIQQGIPAEKAKEVAKFIRNMKLKVQASIQGDTVRVSGRDRDALQQVIGSLRETEFGIDMQFTNYRSS